MSYATLLAVRTMPKLIQLKVIDTLLLFSFVTGAGGGFDILGAIWACMCLPACALCKGSVHRGQEQIC